MYTLILITLLNSQFNADVVSKNITMEQCFDLREQILWPYRNDDFKIAKGVQAVCVSQPDDNK